MRKTAIVVSASALLAGLGVALPASATAAPPGSPQTTQQQAIDRANRTLQALSAPGLTGAISPDQYLPGRVIIGDNGASDVRYARTWRGLPVRGGDFVVHNARADGIAAGSQISPQVQPLRVVNAQPTISADQAEATAQQHFAGTDPVLHAPQLMVDATGSTPRLAWDAVIDGLGNEQDAQTPSRLHTVIDSTSGAILDKWDEIETVSATGNGFHDGRVAIETTKVGGSYQLKDSSRGGGHTCDLNNQGRDDRWGADKLPCTEMTNPQNSWGDGTSSNRESAAVDAHYGAAKTFDYFKSTFGRNGVFGNGQGVPSRVHYGNNYQNAFWDGKQMTYGDGANNENPLTSIDTAGHEMTHGVVQDLAGLGYTREAGGLNEATSDIFGTMLKFYVNDPSDPGSYQFGKSLDLRGDGKPLRYMDQPSLDAGRCKDRTGKIVPCQSYDCWSADFTNLPVDDLRINPHFTSGVGNHFFFLLAEGSGKSKMGDSPTCNGQSVSGIGHEKAAQIWYKALDTDMVLNETYPMARTATLSAAANLYGECSTEYRAVQAAWSAVSVSSKDAKCPVSATGVSRNATSTQFQADRTPATQAVIPPLIEAISAEKVTAHTTQ